VRLPIVLVICAAATIPCAAEMRTWTSSTGKTIEAEFVNAGNGRVLLRGADGKTMNTSFNTLSKEDQAYIETLHKESQEKAAAAKKEAEKKAVREKEKKRAAALAQWQPGKVVRAQGVSP